MLVGLLRCILEDLAADPFGRANSLLGFSSILTYHDHSPEHASNVSHLLDILNDLPLDGVDAMLLLTRVVVVRHGQESVSTLATHSANSGDTDESPHCVVDFPFDI